MGRVLNKVHYYDGRIYERVIDPYFAKVRDRISEIVPSGSRVLDVACGTGALCFKLATKGCEVIGIELSLKMVERAKLRQRQEKIENLQFIHGDATRLEKFSDKAFDIAIISFGLHEMTPDERRKILLEMKRVAKRLIIVDYAVPQPHRLAGITCRFKEIVAGWGHFSRFREFYRLGGLSFLLKEAGIEILDRERIKKETIEIVQVKNSVFHKGGAG
ncbi:27-O-demethylrifamycin SV methyltransferase [subsurface metagenome]